MPALAEAYTDHETQQQRADLYGLLGTLLGQLPDQALLDALCALEVEAAADPLAPAVAELAAVAKTTDLPTLQDAYTRLFIGIGRGEIVPFASWYLSGFVMDKSLSRLRQTLETLGFERQEGVHEPEDHMAALCEVMSHLVAEGPDGRAVQGDFFTRYLLPWAQRFFRDLQKAEAAGDFYRLVGEFGERLIKSEKQYLEAVN